MRDRPLLDPSAPAVLLRQDLPAERPVVLLSDLTTLRVGGPAARYIRVEATDALIDAVSACDNRGEPVLLVGGGSNLVVGDAGFVGTVVHVATRGVDAAQVDDRGGVHLRVAAGEAWDDVVGLAVGQGWAGLEALSGIPGSTGAVPVQNVGAYGRDVAEAIDAVRVWDRLEGRIRTLSNADCEFGYRWSRFKEERFRDGPRFVVLEVTLRVHASDLSVPIRYAELAGELGVEVGECAGLRTTRQTVLSVRRRKGMVVDPADPDSCSAGSFFTNPVLTAEQADRLPAEAPRWSLGEGTVKTSAAWLIERAGFPRGFGLPGAASLSTRHTLAVTNRGGATAEDVLGLARRVRDGVREAFGVELVPEPVLVGCSL